MQALVEALIWVGLLGLFLLLIRRVPWVQKIWMKNGKWQTLHFVLVVMSLLMIKDVITKAFAWQITANLVAQGVGFGVLYAVYALLVLLLGAGLMVDAYKNPDSLPLWLSMVIYVMILIMLLLMPFWL